VEEIIFLTQEMIKQQKTSACGNIWHYFTGNQWTAKVVWAEGL